MPNGPMSEETKQKLREAAQARMASRLATLEPPQAAEEAASPKDEEPASEDVLKQLAGLFAEASGQKSNREKAVTEAIDLLGKLDPFKYPDIADNPTVQAFVEKVQQQRAQSTDVPPGTIIGTGMAAFKKPWTKNDLLKSKDLTPEEARARGWIEWVEYRPIRNFDVTWQGIRIIWPARRLGRFPKAHVDVFEGSLDAELWNEQHAGWLFNVPGVDIHADYFTTNAPRAKAMDMSKGEYYQPGAGAIDMTPSADLIDNTTPEE